MTGGRVFRSSVRTFIRKVGGVALSILTVLLFLLLVLAGVLFYVSPGTPKPFLDASGKPLIDSISEKIKVNINGAEQGMFIKGKNIQNPVLLYLHGGMPDYFLTQHYPTRLDDYFTVAWWEQRGSGLSYRADIPRDSVNPGQLVSDTVEVTNYLRKRFGHEKIYLSRLSHFQQTLAAYCVITNEHGPQRTRLLLRPCLQKTDLHFQTAAHPRAVEPRLKLNTKRVRVPRSP